MKNLVKLRLINWHYFSNTTTDIKNITFLTGPNGTGKSTIIDAMPTWLIDGLNVGGGMIGAVGLAILLQSITNKSLWPYFVIGFVFAAFLGINMIGVGLVAVAAVFLHNYFTSARDERPELEYEDEED